MTKRAIRFNKNLNFFSRHTWYPNFEVHCAASAGSMELKTHSHHQWPQQRPERRPEAVARTMLLTPQRQGFDFRPFDVRGPTSAVQCPTLLSLSTRHSHPGLWADERILCPHVLRLIGTFAECVWLPLRGSGAIKWNVQCGCTSTRCHNSPFHRPYMDVVGALAG